MHVSLKYVNTYQSTIACIHDNLYVDHTWDQANITWACHSKFLGLGTGK